MLSVFENVGFVPTRTLDGGVVEVKFPIAATEGYQARVDERDHVAVTASLRPFFEPGTVAVVGASARPGSIGGLIFRNLLTGGFTGAAYPVNRSGEPVAGVRAYTSLEAIADPIDLCVICLPGEHVIGAAEEALRTGTRALCVISAGFAETGPEGVERQEQLLSLVRAHGARLVGPNCLGIASASVGMNATFAPRAFPAGRIGFSSQSGALGLALLERAEARGLGLSAFVSIGNKADVSSNDLLEWWEDDPGTDLVLMYLESFGNPRKFARIARRLAREKPVLAMKSGRSRAGQKAAGSHTAALAGSDAAVDAVFRQAGVIRADTLSALLDVAALLSSQPVPKGRRVAVLTNAGGLGILCADACEAAGLELPPLAEETRAALAPSLPVEASLANPVDMLGSATAESFERALPLVLADPGIDSVIALFVPAASVGAADVGAAISRAVAAAEQPDKPVLASILAADGAPATLRSDAHVPSFAYPGVRGRRPRAGGASTGEWLRRSAGSIVPVEGVDAAAAAQRDREGARARRRGVARPGRDPQPPRRLRPPARSGARRGRRRRKPPQPLLELGYPAVVKTAAAGAHKTETGGVALDLADTEAVRAAAERIGGPVIVQPMVTGGVELLAGVAQDPVFGPLVAFGPGGVLAELIGDAHFRLAPLTDVDADELVGAGKAGRLVAGFRGAPAVGRGSPRRRPPPALAARGRLPGARRARPQPRHRHFPTERSSSTHASGWHGHNSAPTPRAGSDRRHGVPPRAGSAAAGPGAAGDSARVDRRRRGALARRRERLGRRGLGGGCGDRPRPARRLDGPVTAAGGRRRRRDRARCDRLGARPRRVPRRSDRRADDVRRRSARGVGRRTCPP